jgi:hypothetical protein
VNLNRWLLLGSGVLVLALVGGAAFGWATWTAQEYEKDFDRWLSEQRPRANAKAGVPDWAFGYWYKVDPQDLKDQASGCDEVRAARPALAAATGKLPRITELPIDWLSPTYGKAVDRDHRRAQVVKAFGDAADHVLKQMERDCGFLGEVLRFDVRSDAQWEKSIQLVDPESEPYCGELDGCIPVDAARRQRFASALAKSHDHQRSTESLFRSDECGSTSYGAACEDVADAMDRHLDADDEYLRQVRALTASSSGFAVNQTAKRADRAFARSEKTVRRILTKQVPGVEVFADFAEDPTSPDAFLLAAAHVRLRGLLDERTALTRL